MSIEWIGATGNVIKGHVLDTCSKYNLEQALKLYDPKLYIKWNHKKRNGYGVWEIRRQPDRLTVTHQGGGFNLLEYKELDIVHHVLDIEFLNRECLKRIQEMDAWAKHDYGRNWLSEIDYLMAKKREKMQASQADNRQYMIKQFKREWRELMRLVQSGHSIAHLLKGYRPD